MPAGWRLLCLLVLSVAAQMAAHGFLRQKFMLPTLWAGLIAMFLMGCALALAVRFLDRRPWRDLGFRAGRTWWRELGLGLAISFALVASIFVAQWALGWIRITGFISGVDEWRRVGGVALLMTGVGFYEEAVFRGFLLRNLAEGISGRLIQPKTGLFIGWILSSVLFALAHSSNPNVSLAGEINILWLGAVLALPFLITGSMAISIGLHIGWNFSVGGIFGLPVSGLPMDGSLMKVEQTGPEVWTGGSFGPEGGWLVTLAGFVLAAVLIRLCRRPNDRDSFFDHEIAVYQQAEHPHADSRQAGSSADTTDGRLPINDR